jgi:hypothetical protein
MIADDRNEPSSAPIIRATKRLSLLLASSWSTFITCRIVEWHLDIPQSVLAVASLPPVRD